MYLHVNRDEEILPEDTASFLKWSYIVGLTSPILDWVFMFYYIFRVREINRESNPNFIDSE